MYPKIVAEGCCNHMGDLKIAKEMTRIALLCGADFIKWQKRNPYKSVPLEWHDKPHPCSSNAFGKTYLEHRLNLEFSIEQHLELRRMSRDIGIGYAISVWDIDSLLEVKELDPDFIKIPSAANLNFDLIDQAFTHFNVPVHISLGMTGSKEREEISRFLSHFVKHQRERVVVYHTTTEYPCPFERLYLKEIKLLLNEYPCVGYSGHNYGIAADIAAMALGASWVERHFTLDRTFKGTDHAASLEPEGLRKLCRDIRSVYKALDFKPVSMTPIESEQSKKLRVANER